MKKTFLIIILLLFPIFTKASENYFNAVKVANSYIEKYEDYEKYILINDNVSYAFDENGIKFDRSFFKNGGFLSKTEFEISNINSNSYLSPGIEYWTQSNATDGSKKYCVNYKLSEKDTNSKSGVRITEYAMPKIKVSGKGTHSEPWKFVEQYKIIVGSNNSNGKSEPDYVNYVTTNDSIIIKAIPLYGYTYNGNDCIEDSATYLVTKNFDYSANIKISNPIRDISCRVYFEPRKYNFNLISDGTLAVNSSPNKISLIYNDNWYDGDNVISKLNVLPQRKGFSFKGYTYENSDESPLDVIDENGNITNNKKIVTKDNNSYNLIAKWTSNELIFPNTPGKDYQQLDSVTYSVSNQNVNFNPVTNGTGNYVYTVNGTEKNYFSFKDNVVTINGGTSSGSYTINVTVKDSESNATKEVIFKITIKKQTPLLVLNPSSQEIMVGLSKTFNVKSNIKGSFNITSLNTSIATVTSSNTSVVGANSNVTSTVNGISANTAKITVNFIPSDNTNYNNASIEFMAKITPDTQKPTCNIVVNNSSIKLETFDNVKVVSYGLSNSSSTNYNNIDNITISSGTFYGYVKDSGGNTNSCSINIVQKQNIAYCAQSGYELNSSQNTCYKVLGAAVSTCPSGYTSELAGNCKSTTSPSSYTRNYKYCVPDKWNTSFKTCSITSYAKAVKTCNRNSNSCSGFTSKSACTSRGCSWNTRTRRCSGTYYTYAFGNTSSSTVSSCTSNTFVCNSSSYGRQYVACGAKYGYISSIGGDIGETCTTVSTPACNSSNLNVRYKVGCVVETMQWKTTSQVVSQCSVGGSSSCLLVSDRNNQYTNSCTPYSCPSGYNLSGSICVSYTNKISTCSSGTLSGNYCYSYVSPSYRKVCDSTYTEVGDYCYK